MSELASALARRVEDFVRESPKFKEACDSAFEVAASNAIFSPGSVSLVEAFGLVEHIWGEISPSLEELGLNVSPPSKHEVTVAFTNASRGRTTLNRESFEDFFVILMKNVAGAVASDAAKTYGVGILGGLAAVHVFKRAVRTLPIAGAMVSPFLAFAPTLVVGPLLGVALVWGHGQGDIFAAKKFLTGNRQRQRDE